MIYTVRQPARREGGRLSGELCTDVPVEVVRRYMTPHGECYDIQLTEGGAGYPVGHMLIGILPSEVRS